MNQRKRNLPRLKAGSILLVLLVLVLALSACGNKTVASNTSGTSGTPPTIEAPRPTNNTAVGSSAASSNPTGPAQPADAAGGAPAAAGAEAAGGDEPVLTYTDPTGLFSFQHPQSWGKTTNPGEIIRFTGRDEFISIAITTTTLSPLDFAKADVPALKAASPNFKGDPLTTYTVAGTSGVIESYTWQAGPSPVTGKMVASSARRYYIPGTGGKLAIFTYSSPTSTYDPAGADDFANAFKWLK